MNRWALIILLAGVFTLIVLLTSNGSSEMAPLLATDPNDTDGDGWSDSYEFTYIGTTPWGVCSTPEVQGWPVDFDGSGFVDISDIVNILQFWENPVAPGFPDLQRFDISTEPMGDGIIDISDIALVTGRFGQGCEQ